MYMIFFSVGRFGGCFLSNGVARIFQWGGGGQNEGAKRLSGGEGVVGRIFEISCIKNCICEVEYNVHIPISYFPLLIFYSMHCIGGGGGGVMGPCTP